MIICIAFVYFSYVMVKRSLFVRYESILFSRPVVLQSDARWLGHETFLPDFDNFCQFYHDYPCINLRMGSKWLHFILSMHG
jgi:hypothetical protein